MRFYSGDGGCRVKRWSQKGNSRMITEVGNPNPAGQLQVGQMGPRSDGTLIRAKEKIPYRMSEGGFKPLRVWVTVYHGSGKEVGQADC